jgi:hypothetical protein
MSNRKGEINPAGIDRGWPYQIALLGELSTLANYDIQYEFCKGLSRCNRGHSVFHNDKHYNIHCFSIKEDAQAFMDRFGGEWFDPRDKGKGANWSRWFKGSGGKRT